MQLSPHFTREELTATQHRDPSIVAAQASPPEDVLWNLQNRLCPLLEKIRGRIAGPLLVSSGYRSPVLNALIGGAKHSQHMEGLAADFAVPGLSVRELYDLVVGMALPELDQAIYEFSRWVHVSAAPATRPPRRSLLMIFDPGQYLPWSPLDPRARGVA